MSGEQAGEAVEKAGEDDEPRGLEVKGAAPTVLIGQHVVVAGGDGGPGSGDGDLKERGSVNVAGFAPIKTGVGDDDFNPGDKEEEEAECGNPVSGSNKGGVAGNAGGGRGGGDRARD